MVKVVIGLLMAWMVLSYALIVFIASNSDGFPRGDGIVVTGERPAATVAGSSTGIPAEHIERHARMTSMMRVTGPATRMSARMASDPMWQMMHEPGHIRAEEDYHRRIDRMLARNP
jgi:hypothetical protein